MPDKNKLVKNFIQNRPNLSGNKIYNEMKGKPFSIRKTDFYSLLREVRNLKEPSARKKHISTPIKHRKPLKPSRPSKPTPIPFEKTKFGKITKSLQKTHGISEPKAIIRARALLKVRKRDYRKLNKKDTIILTQYGY